MGKVLIGNIKGPQGPTGVRGGMWLQGTAVTGTSTEETSFPDSGITYAIIGDAYFNTETCDVYACTKAGNPTDAKWVYTGNIKGVKGDTGSTQSIQNAVLEFNEALTRENIESTDTVETIFGKVKKYFSDLGTSAFMNVVNNVTQSEAGQAVLDAAVGKYLEEKKFDISKIIANRNITEPGFVMDGKTVADALTELNGKLNNDPRATFEVFRIVDENQTDHFGVLKEKWKMIWVNGGGYRFVTTDFGRNYSWWLCCAYPVTTYGIALNLPYDGAPKYYRIVNNSWLDPITLG